MIAMIAIEKWMKKRTEERRKARVLQEADAWVVALGGDEVDDHTLEGFASWLEEDPAHQKAYEASSLVWQNAPAWHTAASAQQTVQNSRTEMPWGATRRTGRRAVGGLAWAVSLLCVAGLSLFLYPWNQTTFETAAYEQRAIRLADGSSVKLNGDTELDVHLTDTFRLLRLERGEAFFDVAKDKKRPFVVQVGDGTVEALGTRFNIRMELADITVAVLDGKVQVKSDVAAAKGGLLKEVLVQDELIRFGAGTVPTRLAKADVERLTAWRRGRVIFQNERLAEAVAEVNRYRRIPIELADPELKVLRVTGSFNVDETDDFITALKNMGAVRAMESGQSVTLMMAE